MTSKVESFRKTDVQICERANLHLRNNRLGFGCYVGQKTSEAGVKPQRNENISCKLAIDMGLCSGSALVFGGVVHRTRCCQSGGQGR
jgi:hypothetical protein